MSTVLRYGNYYKEEVYLMIKGREMAYKYILSAVTSLDLSANNLNGQIPEDIGYLRGLQSLNLSHNDITGQIPHEFAEMANLEALDLSNNELSGRIPEAFADLSFLGYLNLSNNNLSGRIPDLPHLDTFGASSFSGNPGLCGTQLQRNCSDHTSNFDQGEDANETVHWWESWKVGMGMGCAIGFGIVIGALTLSRRLRTKYYESVDGIVNLFWLQRLCDL